MGLKQEYYVGIRGNTTIVFDIFFQKTNSEKEKIRTYRGQVELDYTIWTKNSVFLFEAKQVKQGSLEYYLDIGWHKFAYAGVRFLNYQNLAVYPVYFLRLKNTVFLFVFPRLCFYEKGIILNDNKQMTPEKVFSISLD